MHIWLSDFLKIEIKYIKLFMHKYETPAYIGRIAKFAIALSLQSLSIWIKGKYLMRNLTKCNH